MSAPRLVPYGTPKYSKIIKETLIDIKEDGSFKLNQEYFNYCTGLTMTNNKFNLLFKNKPRDVKKENKSVPYGYGGFVQDVVEEILIKLVVSLKKNTKLKIFV